MTVPLSDKKKGIYRKQMSWKGREIAQKIARLVAGQPVSAGGLARVQGIGDGLSVEKQLRAYLKHIVGARQALDRDDGTFGLCWRCGGDIRGIELDQQPWVNETAFCGDVDAPPPCTMCTLSVQQTRLSLHRVPDSGLTVIPPIDPLWGLPEIHRKAVKEGNAPFFDKDINGPTGPRLREAVQRHIHAPRAAFRAGVIDKIGRVTLIEQLLTLEALLRSPIWTSGSVTRIIYPVIATLQWTPWRGCLWLSDCVHRALRRALETPCAPFDLLIARCREVSTTMQREVVDATRRATLARTILEAWSEAERARFEAGLDEEAPRRAQASEACLDFGQLVLGLLDAEHQLIAPERMTHRVLSAAAAAAAEDDQRLDEQQWQYDRLSEYLSGTIS